MEDMTTKEVATELGITTRRVVQLIEEGELIARKRGRDWFIKREDLNDYKNRGNGQGGSK